MTVAAFVASRTQRDRGVARVLRRRRRRDRDGGRRDRDRGDRAAGGGDPAVPRRARSARGGAHGRLLDATRWRSRRTFRSSSSSTIRIPASDTTCRSSMARTIRRRVLFDGRRHHRARHDAVLRRSARSRVSTSSTAELHPTTMTGHGHRRPREPAGSRSWPRTPRSTPTRSRFRRTTPTTLTLDNQDSAAHNLSIYEDDTASGEPLFTFEPFPGPATETVRRAADPRGRATTSAATSTRRWRGRSWSEVRRNHRRPEVATEAGARAVPPTGAAETRW